MFHFTNPKLLGERYWGEPLRVWGPKRNSPLRCLKIRPKYQKGKQKMTDSSSWLPIRHPKTATLIHMNLILKCLGPPKIATTLPMFTAEGHLQTGRTGGQHHGNQHPRWHIIGPGRRRFPLPSTPHFAAHTFQNVLLNVWRKFYHIFSNLLNNAAGVRLSDGCKKTLCRKFLFSSPLCSSP